MDSTPLECRWHQVVRWTNIRERSGGTVQRPCPVMARCTIATSVATLGISDYSIQECASCHAMKCESLFLRPAARARDSPTNHDLEQALDKALVAWGVKSPPGEPEIDFKEKIKSAGLAGALAYGGTELAFWIISVPLAVFTYYRTTGEWLDLTTLEGKEKASGVYFQ